MKLFKIVLDFHTYGFTASYERGYDIGNIAYPSPYIHNYSLIYGFNSMGTEYIIYKNQKLYQFVDNKIKKGEPIYSLPATSNNFKLRAFFYSTKSESMVERKKKPQKVYPSSGKYFYFAPLSMFETYVVAENSMDIPPIIRFGKKREGLLYVKEKKECEYDVINGKYQVSFPFNPHDISGAANIISKKVLFKIKGDKSYSNMDALEVAIGEVEGNCIFEKNTSRYLLLPKSYINKL